MLLSPPSLNMATDSAVSVSSCSSFELYLLSLEAILEWDKHTHTHTHERYCSMSLSLPRTMQPSSVDNADGQPLLSPSPRVLRSPAPSSLLEHTRQTQIAAQAHRTAERIRQLTPEAESFGSEEVTQDQGYGSRDSVFTGIPLRSNLFTKGHVATGTDVVDWRTSNLPRTPFKDSSPLRGSAGHRDFSLGEPAIAAEVESSIVPEVTAQPIPATLLRRNITDGTVLPRASLLSRRSTSRLQDQRYVLESTASVQDCV
jgi:hypothetical protein